MKAALSTTSAMTTGSVYQKRQSMFSFQAALLRPDGIQTKDHIKGAFDTDSDSDCRQSTCTQIKKARALAALKKGQRNANAAVAIADNLSSQSGATCYGMDKNIPSPKHNVEICGQPEYHGVEPQDFKCGPPVGTTTYGGQVQQLEV